MQTSIEIDRKKYEIEGGLIRADAIYAVVEGTSECLFMSHPDGTDIPLDSENVLVIQGNEVFVTGERSLEDNPPLKKPVQILFNGEPRQALSKAKITGRELKNFDQDLPQGRLFVVIGTGPDAEITDEMAILVQESNAFLVIPGTNEGDPVDIEECAQHGRPPPKGQKYLIKIDGEKYLVEEEKITGAEILALAGKNSEEWALNQKLSGGKRERVEADGFVNLSQPGVERFETVRRQAQQGHG